MGNASATRDALQSPIVELTAATKSFVVPGGQTFQALRGISVRIDAGEENIVLAMDFVGKVPAAKRRPRARELLELVGLTDQISKLPSTLSGGQQRWTFALRNTVRRKWRLAFTVTGLAVGGAVLLTTVNHYKSLMGVIDAVMEDRGHDLHVVLQRPIATS